MPRHCFRFWIPFCLLLFASLTYPVVSYGQTTQNDQIDALLTQYYEAGQINGMFLVAEANEVLLNQGYGYADLEDSVSFEPQMNFNVASLSKQFTAALALLLVESGKLALDDPISLHLPNYRKDVGQQVTIQHLLTHQSGIPSFKADPHFWSFKSSIPYSDDELLKLYCSEDLAFDPGTGYAYNNVGYYLLGRIIENVTEQPFHEVLRQRILEPLGLNNTGINGERGLPHKVIGYEKTLEGYIPARTIHMRSMLGLGSMYSTTKDLLKWSQALHSGQVLTLDTYRHMVSPQLFVDSSWLAPEVSQYGFGLGIANFPGKEFPTESVVFHSGHLHSCSAFLVHFMQRNRVLIFLNNAGGISTKKMHEIALNINRILNDKVPNEPRIYLSDYLYQTLDQRGIGAVVRNGRHALKRKPSHLEINASELDKISTHLLQASSYKTAQRLLKLSLAKYPTHWPAANQLAFAYFKQRKFRKAKKYYEKSAQLNPQRTTYEIQEWKHTKQQLERL